ncbi:MAG: NUDIX domain-containing protein [Proteobacteria bacterium]|nr:NUDIX domain-containing protein [Pseudomonadota bacterium]
MAIISAFAIIKNDLGEILLCHRRDKDLWNLPGGGVEVGESPWEAVVREVQEEIGLVVRVNHLTGIYSKPNHDELSFSFQCEVIGGDLIQTDEADEIEYFSIDNFPSNTSQRQVERVQDAISRPNIVILKQQDVALKSRFRSASASSTIDILYPID